MSEAKTVPIGELSTGTIVHYEDFGSYEILPFDTPPVEYVRPDWVKLILVGHPNSMYHQEPTHLVAVDLRAWESLRGRADQPRAYIVSHGTPVVPIVYLEPLREWDE